MCENLIKKLENEINELTAFLEHYEIIINAHTNDFFTNALWEEMKGKYKLDDKKVEDRYIKECEYYSNVGCCFDVFASDHCKYCESQHAQLKLNNSGFGFYETKKYETVRNTFLDEKKEHEIEKLVPLIKMVARDVKCNQIVDFGSGKGYLGYELCMRHSFQIVGIEGDSHCSISSEKWKEKKLSGTTNDESLNIGSFKTINYKIDGSNSTSLVEHIEKLFDGRNNNKKEGSLLVGLHACGDLTSTAIEMYATNVYFRGLVIVGCCYNLLTNGFPLSSCLKKKDYHLTKNAKMLACQCPDKWKSNGQVLSKSLLYRAMFEKLLQTKRCDSSSALRDIKFRKVGKRSNNFKDYASTILERCSEAGWNLTITEEEIQNVDHLYSKHWDSLQQFHWLRMQLAPCVERLIIIDRLMYLLELGWYNSDIVQVFAKSKSPRCYAIVSLKDKGSDEGR